MKIAAKTTINGLLNFNKPRDITSHDLVIAVRRITGVRKVGHTGTLDPFATGVMVICLGNATKLSRELTGKRKIYYGRMRLGIRTDSHDGTGKVLSTVDSFQVDRDQILRVLEEFVGEIEQIPPMFSAVKYQGKPLYKLARKGIVVERQPKLVNIYRLELKKIDGKYIEFEAETSAGTYIRTLCDSIGERLGCGAYLSELTRTCVGEFTLDDSLTLEEFREIMKGGGLEKVLIPIENYPALALKDGKYK